MTAAVEAQRARGPDHADVAQLSADERRAQAIFGHNRLSIIDLSDAANQPMWDTDRRVCIVYNGEIYNYLELRRELEAAGAQFRTRSDTEVILEAFKCWGADSFQHLNGMFALALFDGADGRLWLVRDRFGVKPLYYALATDGVAFASTPGPIARSLRRPPNLEYVARGLQYWLYDDDGGISPYESVLAVPPGHYAIADLNPGGRPVIQVRQWYDFHERVAHRRDDLASQPEPALTDRLGALLEDAVVLRLRSDVPIGMSLSGGLDSASIAALVASSGAEVVGFAFGRPDEAWSEGPMAHAVARKTGMGIRYTWPDDSAATAALWETLDAQDAPFPGLSLLAQFLVFKRAKADGIKVLLGGQGSDEMLMGYRKFQLMLLRQDIGDRSWKRLLSGAGGVALMLAAEAQHASVYLRQWRRYLRPAGLRTRLRVPPARDLQLGSGRRQVWERQVLDVTRLSLPTLLRYEDRNSTANSLETRLPYLDYRFAELAAALPDALKVRGGYGKWALREAMRGHVPDRIRTARYKRGFDAPTERWIAGGIGDAIRARLAERRALIAEWLPRDERVEDLFSNERLTGSATAIAEATSLLWLMKRA